MVCFTNQSFLANSLSSFVKPFCCSSLNFSLFFAENGWKRSTQANKPNKDLYSFLTASVIGKSNKRAMTGRGIIANKSASIPKTSKNPNLEFLLTPIFWMEADNSSVYSPQKTEVMEVDKTKNPVDMATTIKNSNNSAHSSMNFGSTKKATTVWALDPNLDLKEREIKQLVRFYPFCRTIFLFRFSFTLIRNQFSLQLRISPNKFTERSTMGTSRTKFSLGRANFRASCSC